MDYRGGNCEYGNCWLGLADDTDGIAPFKSRFDGVGKPTIFGVPLIEYW